MSNFRLSLISASILLSSLGLSFTQCTSPRSKYLSEAVESANQMKNNMIDDETRFDSASIAGDSAFVYNYTLVNIAKDEVTPELFDLKLKPLVTDATLQNADMTVFWHKNINVCFIYFSKHGEKMYEMCVTPADYAAYKAK